jgi:DHA2 family multidrug resistance protein
VVAASAIWLFITYSITAKHPFFDPRLFKDRVFAACCMISLFFYMLLSSTMAMTPTLMQTLLGYPVQTAGLLMMPRGLGCFAGMMVVGRITGVVDSRLLLLIGLLLLGFSEWQMSRFDLTMPQWPLIASALTQGAGMGFIAVVLSAAGFATLPAALRAEATTVFYIVRNIGQSAGISTMQTLLVRNQQTMHASLAAQVAPTDPMVSAALGSLTAPGAEMRLRALDAEVNRQASMVAYLDDFRLMTAMIVIVMPLLLLMRAPRRGHGPGARA